MALNIFRNPLRQFAYQQNQIDVEMSHSVNHHEIRLRLTGQLDVAGGNADGTLLEDGTLNLLDYFQIQRDGDDIVQRISGRDLFTLGRYATPRLAYGNTNASPMYPYLGPPFSGNAGVQAATLLAVDFIVPLSWRFLANPYDVFLASTQIKQSLRIFAQFNTTKSNNNANTTVGSGAIISGGNRDVVVSNVQLTIVEVYSTTARKPLYEPRITVGQSAQIAAADAKFRYDLKTDKRVMSHLFMMREGVLQASVDKINAVTLYAGGSRWINAESFAMLKSEERQNFDVPSTDRGVLFQNYLDNGKLGTALDPKRLGSDPRYEFDVSAPGAGNIGIIKVIGQELRTIPGITSVQDAGQATS